jgi:replicative DNA helicase
MKTDLLPPSNLEAEQGVLGSCLLDNSLIPLVAGIVERDSFYRDSHQIVWETLLGLHKAGHPVDAITLADELTRRGDFEKAGGDDGLAALLSVPSASNGSYYAQIVRQKHVSRSLIEAANVILQDNYSNKYSAEDLTARAKSAITAIYEKGSGTTDGVLGARAANAIAKKVREERLHGFGQGTSTGYPSIDQAIVGLLPGTLTIIGGRPGMGKSALALNIAENVLYSDPQGPGVLYFSLEMRSHLLIDRIVSHRSGISLDRLMRGRLDSKEECEKVDEAGREIDGFEGRFFIDDTPRRSINQIAGLAHAYKAKCSLGLVILDYLQLVTPPEEKGRDRGREQEVAKMSRELKILAGEINAPIIVVAQLNRQNEAGGKIREPRLSDLRESGSIEQDADNVIFTHRPEYYESGERPGEADLVVSKVRSGGKAGKIPMLWKGEFTRFEERPFSLPAVDPAILPMKPKENKLERKNTNRVQYYPDELSEDEPF